MSISRVGSGDKEIGSEKKFTKKKIQGEVKNGWDFQSASVRLHPDDEKILIRRA